MSQARVISVTLWESYITFWWTLPCYVWLIDQKPTSSPNVLAYFSHCVFSNFRFIEIINYRIIINILWICGRQWRYCWFSMNILSPLFCNSYMECQSWQKILPINCVYLSEKNTSLQGFHYFTRIFNFFIFIALFIFLTHLIFCILVKHFPYLLEIFIFSYLKLLDLILGLIFISIGTPYSYHTNKVPCSVVVLKMHEISANFTNLYRYTLLLFYRRICSSDVSVHFVEIYESFECMQHW